ncbi:MAG: hypothetical protein A3J66_01220 [Candidatus Magasanikbacteria bacterium RIFCSPHIGHO2_02_FULL_47_14]|uniref:Large ribosomal subunit protein bL35 n=1 Tax=Candidatus Magasanikbacteria bacterium RIFCSPHIGHO2_02_FULL_47_14 TaxID=1798680 RepID=A0A1F6M7A3_9BACT|nr:MAG: hypothetical protein A3J66_01220 [Candidatus Magasanikbacteria bacterium RIFCSPHIGHO2_02_FULL_47_14]
MPKMKTHKATAKRFRVKKTKKGIKIIKRTDGQDHFNARESGKTRRNKRSDKSMQVTHTQKTILQGMPYNY